MAQDTALLAARLLADGYCIVEGALPLAAVAALDRDLDPRFATTPFCEGGFYGARTKRFGALLHRSVHAEALVRHRLILDLVEAARATDDEPGPAAPAPALLPEDAEKLAA